MKVIDLLNKIANGEIEDKRTFNINFGNGVYRSIYYDKDEDNCMCCLKNVSDDYSIYDAISFDTEIATIEEDKKIEKIDLSEWAEITYKEDWEMLIKDFNRNCNLFVDKINEIIDYLEENK